MTQGGHATGWPCHRAAMPQGGHDTGWPGRRVAMTQGGHDTRTRRRPLPGQRTQSNSELTELSSLMRRIASAINGATLIWRMLCARRTASVARIESVIVIVSIGEDAMRATAPPDSTPCVV